MFRPRVIPVLLLKNLGLVKSIKFKDHRYIGDPINAVKIFNDKKADELVFLDILASKEGRPPNHELIQKIADESNMPFAYGGGIKSMENIRDALKYGAEKVVINSAAIMNTDFVKQASEEFGTSTIVVSVDVKKNIFGSYKVFTHAGSHKTNLDPLNICLELEGSGAGEIILNSIDRDGTMEGYDLDLVKLVTSRTSIPIVATGGAGSYDDFRLVVSEGGASAVAAGSMFVYHGARRAVLISFPSPEELKGMFL
ncbi:MAG: imidazole glycerol phosphate synthase subunit HisF [Ignavibacteriales bacterium]